MHSTEGRSTARAGVGDCEIVVVQGDLIAQRVDAVVNAANERLAHGGGVAAALARAGGPAVQASSTRWVAEHGPLSPGRAAVTTAGDLPARMLIHVAGPRFQEGQDNEGLLRAAVEAALDAGRDEGAGSMALPAISAGIFGYPPRQAAEVIARTCAQWLDRDPGGLRHIRLVGYDDDGARHFADALESATA